MNRDVTEIVRRLAAIFRDAGHSLYQVGGSVRDGLLGRPVVDADFATDARPAQIKRLGARARPDAVYAVGERFGTIGFVFGEHKIEITTFRGEVYTPRSRKPRVRFGISLRDDLARRDFTINAMALDPLTGEIADLFGGRADLQAGTIRAVGNPIERFAEDPLRLMRAARFVSQLDFSIDPATAEAMIRCADQLDHISRERVLEEVNRILLSHHPSAGLRALVDYGLMTYVIPEMLEMPGMEQEGWHHKDVYEHVLTVVDNAAGLSDGLERPKQLALLWGALLHDIAKPRTRGLIFMCRVCGQEWFSGRDTRLKSAPETVRCQRCGSTDVYRAVHFRWHEQIGERMARDILGRLRADHKLIESVARVVGLHGRVNAYQGEWTEGAVRRFIREIGDDLEIMFRLSRADITSRRPEKVRAAIERIAELEERTRELLERENVRELKSPLDGHELMRMFGRPPGPWIRQVKEYLLGLVIEGELGEDDVDRARQLAGEFLESLPAA